MKLCIVSGGKHSRLQSHLNHQAYALRHSYDFHHDLTPYPPPLIGPTISGSYFKLQAVENVLHRYEWVFWLDDDAFFTDFDRPIANFLLNLAPSIFFLVCKSPINPRKQNPFLNSGAFFIRNCTEGFAFLQEVQRTRVGIVRSWWNRDELGRFTRGDQDSITYVLHQQNLLACTKFCASEDFNARHYHYKEALNEHLVIHFPGKKKENTIAKFAARFGANTIFTPESKRAS